MFELYRKSLQRQISGRTGPLNDVLEVVEGRIRSLHGDLDSVEVGADETSWVSHCGLTFVLCLRLDRSLIAQVFEMYKTDAAILCDDIVTLLQESLALIPTVTGMHKNM